MKQPKVEHPAPKNARSPMKTWRILFLDSAENIEQLKGACKDVGYTVAGALTIEEAWAFLDGKDHADVIAAIIRDLRTRQPDLPVVFDPVLANGAGDTLSNEDPIAALAPLFALATVITPNRIEANRLCGVDQHPDVQAQQLLARGCRHVLLKGGHGPEQDHVLNRWYTKDQQRSWSWPRLS